MLFTHVFFFFTADMGLDLVCGSISERVGSYSGVHRQRAAWIYAESARQKSLGNKNLSDRMRKTIISEDKINYRDFDRIEDWLPGTKAFVSCSDHDGFWSQIESKDILDAVRILEPFFRRIDFILDFHQKQYYLKNILEYSVQNNENIYFC